MKNFALLCIFSLLTMGLASASEGKAVTLEGSYVWKKQPNKPGNIKAIFTPTAPKQWQVTFLFSFRGENLAYSGTAEGDLKNGALKGEVQNDGKNRTFNFTGESKDGQFAGTHSEQRDGGNKKTGSINLSRQLSLP